VEFTKMRIDNFIPNIMVLNFWINRTSSNISAIYANFKFAENVYNVTGQFSLNFKYTDKYVNYLTLELDFCKGMQSLYTQYVARILESELRSVSNYPLDCPFKKNYEYYINGFAVSPDVLPSYFPLVSFKSNITFLRNLKPAVNISVSGRTRRK
ncbi:hypothetical protein KR215_002085, partial [Drosophila sulfurigaster]